MPSSGPDDTVAVPAAPAQERLRAALVRHREGDLDGAIAAYQSVLADLPDSFDAQHLLGVALHQAGEAEAARGHLQGAIGLRPQSAEARFNLAKADQETGRLAEAEAGYRAAIAARPGFVDAYVNLAGLLLDRGDSAGGRRLYEQAVVLSPGTPAARIGHGVALAETGDLAGAREAFEAVLASTPGHAGALVNLARLAEREGQPAEARALFERAAMADPEDVTAIAAWGQQLRREGRTDAARGVLDRRLARRWDPATALLKALCLPVIAADGTAIDEARDRLDADLNKLLDPPIGSRRHNGPVLDELPFRVDQTLFHLAYHGRDDRAMMEKAARVLLRICPELGRTASSVDTPAGDRLRVGVVSRHLHGHTIGHLNLGLIEHLPRDRFHVTLFRFAERRDDLADRIDAAADAVVRLPLRLSMAQDSIADTNPDILYFPDVGMDPFTWFLAFARLAPLQCATWGHPVTTGLPSMDLFLSGRHIDPEDAGRFYSEDLIRLETSVPFVYRPDIPTDLPEGTAARAALGLPADRRLYVCPQSLFKLHPDFDPVLDRILAEDPKAEIVLIAGEHDYWADLLRRRFARRFPDAVTRVRFLPRLTHRQFMLLLRTADILLDPPRFGGGKSSLEMFAAGRAVVTWPSPLLRDRLTHGFYQMMEMADASVEDADRYGQLALSLAQDPDRRRLLEEQIKERCGVLFENRGWIDEVAAVWTAGRP